jgi:hypothetical protein
MYNPEYQYTVEEYWKLAEVFPDRRYEYVRRCYSHDDWWESSTWTDCDEHWACAWFLTEEPSFLYALLRAASELKSERQRAMLTQSSDTSPEIERVQIELLRKASLQKRFAITEAWSEFIREVARQGIRRDYPDASEEEVSLILVARLYGQPLADKVRAYLARRKQQ